MCVRTHGTCIMLTVMVPYVAFDAINIQTMLDLLLRNLQHCNLLVMHKRLTPRTTVSVG